MTDKLNDQLLESLSSLCDGESSEIESRRILKEMGSNDSLRDCWQRYNLIGSIMRKERDVALNIDVSKAVSEAISSQDDNLRSSQNSSVSSSHIKKRWQEFFGKSMVAAGVAAVMVVGVNQIGGSDIVGGVEPVGLAEISEPESSPEELSLNPDLNAVDLGFNIPLPEARTVSNQSLPANTASYMQNNRVQVSFQNDDVTDVETQELLNHLLIQHAHRASANGSLGLMPFARVSQMDQVTK